MSKKVLITGVTGFVGSHLAEYILVTYPGEYEIHGTTRTRSPLENLVSIEDQIELHNCNLTDPNRAHVIIETLKPDYIFLYAANSFVQPSWDSPSLYFLDNPKMFLHLLDAIRRLRSSDFDPVVFVACTAEQYGLVISSEEQYNRLVEKGIPIEPPPQFEAGKLVPEVPIKESNPFRPLSPYAVGKIEIEYMARQYHTTNGMKIVIARCFNQEGPRRGKEFVISNFARQIALIEAGRQKPIIYHGNLDALKDWSDVRDTVQAHWRLTTQGEIYGSAINIGSGKSHSVKEMLNMLLDLTDAEIELQQDSERMRPSDVPIQQADITRVSKAIGWKPQIPFSKTLEDTLNYWRERV